MRKISRIAIEDWEDKPNGEKVAGVFGRCGATVLQLGGRGAGEL